MQTPTFSVVYREVEGRHYILPTTIGNQPISEI